MVRTVQTFPLATLQRVFLARVPFIVLYILSLLSPSCQFCSPLIFRPFSTLPLLRAAPSPRRPSLCLRAPRSLRSAFAPFAHPFDSCSKEISERFVREQPFKTVTCALQTARKASAIPLKSRKTQIFSNFLSQSLARFRKSPYFCTR